MNSGNVSIRTIQIRKHAQTLNQIERKKYVLFFLMDEPQPRRRTSNQNHPDYNKFIKTYTNDNLTMILDVDQQTGLGSIAVWGNSPPGNDADTTYPDWRTREFILVPVREEDGRYFVHTGSLRESNFSDVKSELKNGTITLPTDTLSELGEGDGSGEIDNLIDIGFPNPFALNTGNLFSITLPDWMWLVIMGVSVIRVSDEKSNKVLWYPVTAVAGYKVYKRYIDTDSVNGFNVDVKLKDDDKQFIKNTLYTTAGIFAGAQIVRGLMDRKSKRT